MKLILFLGLIANSFAQYTAPHGDYMANYHIPFEKRFKLKNKADFEYQKGKDQLSAGKSFLYSLAIPGLGQYLNGDEKRSFIYLAAEILGWTLYTGFTNDGDKQTKVVEAYVNNPNSGFDRLRFYRNLYEAKHGAGSAPRQLAG